MQIPTTEEIERLVEAGAPETLTREFKAAAYRKNDDGKKECLKDISAFANTNGGTILIGISESANAAEKLTPLTTSDAESERSRINDLIHHGLEPRVFGVRVEVVAVPGGAVLAIAVPRSPARPHRVTSGNSNRFWLRNSTSAYEANVAQLRALVLQSAEITERGERYHRDRIPLIRSGDVVPEIAKVGDGIFLHIVPADAFSGASTVDATQAIAISQSFRPIASDGYTPRFTFDGFLNVRGGDPSFGYTLVRRDGIVEAVKMKLSGVDAFPADDTEARIVRSTHRYCEGLQSLGVAPPYYAYVTLVGTKGLNLVTQHFPAENEPLNKNSLPLPVTTIETAAPLRDIALAFKPAMDAMWNAWGYEGCRSYQDGNWVPKPVHGIP